MHVPKLNIIQLMSVTLVQFRQIYVQLHGDLLLNIIICLRSIISVDLEAEPIECPRFLLMLFQSVEIGNELRLSLNYPRQKKYIFFPFAFFPST